MAKDSESRRAWVKNAAIIFLVILLLLTFFSNTILNYSLPEVSAQYARYGTLTTAVKVSGTIKANESYNVVYEAEQAEAEGGTVQSRKVLSVYVKEGDTVAKDSPILELQGGASQQLEAAQKEYDELKKTYDLALLDDTVGSLTSDKTLADAKKAIEDAKETLAELQKEYTALLNGVDTTSIIEDRIEALEENIEELTEQIATVNAKISEIKGKISSAEGMIEEDIFSTLTVAEKLEIAESDYAVAEEAYNTLTREVEFYKTQLDEIKASSGDISEANTLTTQLKTLEDQLESLELERERYIEDFYNKYLSDNADYMDLQNAYNEAKKTYDTFKKNNETDINRYESLQIQAGVANDNLSKLNEKVAYYESVVAEYEIAEDRWENALSIGVSEEDKAILKAEVERLASVVAGAYDNLPSDAEIAAAKNAAETAQKELAEVQSLVDALSHYELNMSNALKALEAAKKDYIAPDDTTYERKLDDYDDKIESLRDQIEEVEDKLDIIGMPEVDNVVDYAVSYDLAQAQKNYDDASANLTEVTEKYNTAKASVESLRKQNAAEENITEYETLLATYEEELDTLEALQKQKNKDLTAANKELSGASAPKDPETVADQIKETQDTIASLEAQLKITEATQAKADTSTKLDREAQLKQLEELAAKIEAYKTAPETTSVTAPIAGRIVSVNYVPGDTVTSGNTVASIEIADKGYVCEISMAAEEARKIQVGSPCSVVNNWWYNNIEASVTQIRSDPQSQGKNRIVIIEVKGDVSEGQSVTFSIGDKSQSYDTVLPNSAIREDNDGKFVLVVESKNSPLGTRYTARRMNIEITASDDTQSAVSGLYGSEFVITNSTIPISDGQRVRLAENG